MLDLGEMSQPHFWLPGPAVSLGQKQGSQEGDERVLLGLKIARDFCDSLFYQVVKRLTLLPISQISRDLIQRCGGDSRWRRLFRYAVISMGRCFEPLFWRKRPGASPGACYLS